jgi:hypothetical protein
VSALLDGLLKPVKRPKTKPPENCPQDVLDKTKRARDAMRKDASKRRVCQKFWEGDQYWYVNSKGGLSYMDTALVSAERPRHRIRNTYNFAVSIVEGKVSASSQRVPGYEVTPSTNDPQDISAARLAGQIATFGYDKWRVRRHVTKLITTALVQREGFVMPYFDPNVGPFTQDENGEWHGQGEIRLIDLTRSEVGWEPAVDFEDSPFWIVERAQLKEKIKQIPGFTGVDLEESANTADVPKKSDEMAVLTEFLERPCPDYPQGRRMFLVDKRVVVDYRNDPDCPPDWDKWWAPYPVMDADDKVIDEPPLHRLSYTVNAEGDDLGLMERLIDLQRTINDCWNKLLEWKNRALLPQMIAPRGSGMSPRTDEPGAVYEYNPTAGGKPEWEQNPPVPRELLDLLNLAIDHMRLLAADIDVQPDPNLAAKTANAAIESSRARWQSFLGDLAEVHSRLMRHCLTLVARYYTDERQVQINGGYDWASLPDFKGQDIRSQVNVRVLPGSLETKSREQIMQELEFVQTNWPGAISPETAIAVLHGGSADALLKSPQYDIARAARLVRLMEQGMETLVTTFPPVLRPMPQQVPGPVDPPTTGAPTMQTQTVMQEVPGWMPRKQDNIAIYKQVIGDAMKTPRYDEYPPDIKEIFNLVWSGLEFSEQEQAMERASMEQQMAQGLGMANAAKPQGQIAQPSKPAIGNGAPNAAQ